MRHSSLHSCHIQYALVGAEALVIVQTAINLERRSLCSVDSSISWGITCESCHLNAIAHLKVMILAEDIA